MAVPRHVAVDPERPGLKVTSATGRYVRIWKEPGKTHKTTTPLGTTTDLEEAKELYDERWPRAGGSLKNLDLTCDELFVKLIERGGRAPATVNLYTGSYYNYAQKVIGDLKPIDVQPEQIVVIYERMIKHGSARTKGGVRSGKKLDVASYEHVETCLSALFKMCINVPFRCARTNPVTGARQELERLLDKHVREQFDGEAVELVRSSKVVSEHEIELIGENFVGNYFHADNAFYLTQLRTMLVFVSETGCRLGEALGLRISDLVYGDLVEDPYVRFRRQRAIDADKSDPATWGAPLKSSRAFASKVRDTPLSELAVRTLQAYVDEGLANGWLDRPTTENGQRPLLFPDRKRTPRSVSSVSRAFGNAAVRAGLRRITPHDLRHTYATRLYANGVSEGEIATNMGDSVLVVVNTYLHDYNAQNRFKRTAAALNSGVGSKRVVKEGILNQKAQ